MASGIGVGNRKGRQVDSGVVEGGGVGQGRGGGGMKGGRGLGRNGGVQSALVLKGKECRMNPSREPVLPVQRGLTPQQVPLFGGGEGSGSGQWSGDGHTATNKEKKKSRRGGRGGAGWKCYGPTCCNQIRAESIGASRQRKFKRQCQDYLLVSSSVTVPGVIRNGDRTQELLVAECPRAM